MADVTYIVGVPVTVDREVEVMPDLNTRQRCVLALLWLAAPAGVKLTEGDIYKMMPARTAGNDQHVRRALRQLEKRGLAKAVKTYAYQIRGGFQSCPLGNCNYKWSAA